MPFSRKAYRPGTFGATIGPSHHSSVPGLAEYATSQGWRPLGGNPISGMLQSFAHDTTRVMYGAPRDMVRPGGSGIRVTSTVYRAAYGGTLHGRDFEVANGWTSIIELRPIAVCALELPVIVPLTWIELQRFGSAAPLREVSTGDAAFEQRFLVSTQDPAFAEALLTPEIRQLMMGRDNWVFILAGNRLGCLAREAFTSADYVLRRLAEVQAIVAAIPPSVMLQKREECQGS